MGVKITLNLNNAGHKFIYDVLLTSFNERNRFNYTDEQVSKLNPNEIYETFQNFYKTNNARNYLLLSLACLFCLPCCLYATARVMSREYRSINKNTVSLIDQLTALSKDAANGDSLEDKKKQLELIENILISRARILKRTGSIEANDPNPDLEKFKTIFNSQISERLSAEENSAQKEKKTHSFFPADTSSTRTPVQIPARIQFAIV